MKKNKKIIVSAVSVLALLLNLFLPAAAWAYTLSLPSLTSGGSINIDVNDILQEVDTTGISSVSSQLEDRYGLNKDTWKTAQLKATAPRVEIFFDNTNPKVGEKVTAHAVPEFFKNDPHNLYYTWYIVHTTDGRPQTAIGSDPIRAGKIEAGKIMARGDYDPDLADQNYSDPSDDPDKDGAPSVDPNSYDENDNAAPFGGLDGTGQSCYKHMFGTNMDSRSTDDSSGEDTSISCDHKWKSAPNYTSGSGKFPNREEEYWETDPTDPDTDGDGFKDEADVIGLGQESFTWSYQAGDRVGAVVEGTSMIPIDENNAYFKLMWGHPDVCDNTKSGLISEDNCDEPTDFGYGFWATKSPSEEGDEKLKVSLSFSPDEPVADPSDEDNSENIDSDGSISDADKITVASSLDNTSLDPSTLYYTWQIQKGTVGDEDSWKELAIADYFDTTTGTKGLGLSSLSFTPKTGALKGGDDIVNFKVTLTVSKSSGSTAGRGRSSVTIPINKKGIKLKFYKVDVNENGKATLGDEICKDGLYKTLCPVVEGQMVAAEVSGSYTSSNSDFSWSINETAYPVPTGLSDSFDEWSDTRVFFPITQSEKDTPSVVVTATPKDSLQPVTGTRLLTVVAPTAFINSSDTSSSWLKTYEDADGQTVESSGFFEAYADTEISYSLDFLPDYLFGSDSNTTIDWQIDGESISSEEFFEDDFDISGLTTEDSSQTIKFTTGSTETSHTLGVTVKKYWSTDEKSLIYSTWGITPGSLSDDSSISIETMSSEDTVAAANTPGQILAATGTHLPHYFMYLLRLVLTMAVMFFVSSGFYGLSQRLSLSDEEN
jgi:hypothetical protein